MRLTMLMCHKKNCFNLVRTGFRFCMNKNCGKGKGDEEE